METFVPLYISNYCDSNCRICNMRNDNSKLYRKKATLDEIQNQLKIIREVEKISAVCFLTGEHNIVVQREENINMLIECIKNAFNMDFKKVYFNIGALDLDEINLIKEAIGVNKNLILSLFQETYDKDIYSSYFGSSQNSPKSDFEKRYSTPIKWVEAGFSSVDVGILVGLKPLESELDSLFEHIRLIQNASNKQISIHISLPRLKGGCINDIEYCKLIHTTRNIDSNHKLIITTRENIDFINSVINYIDIVSPGSSDICPYTLTGDIPNNPLTSQFVIDLKRKRPSEILNNLVYKGDILYYER